MSPGFLTAQSGGRGNAVVPLAWPCMICTLATKAERPSSMSRATISDASPFVAAKRGAKTVMATCSACCNTPAEHSPITSCCAHLPASSGRSAFNFSK